MRNQAYLKVSFVAWLWVGLLSASPILPAAEAPPFSEANTLLFMTPQMTQVKVGDKVVYDFTQTAPNLAPVKDTITLNLALKDNTPEATLEYLTGTRNHWTPSFTKPEGNPVLMLFLQLDIYELASITGGQWRRFQKDIKLALENDAKVEAVDFTYAGKTQHGKKITIQPYLHDQGLFSNPIYSHKSYEFIVSDAVPGGLYRLATQVPNEAAQPNPLASTEIVLH